MIGSDPASGGGTSTERIAWLERVAAACERVLGTEHGPAEAGLRADTAALLARVHEELAALSGDVPPALPGE